MRIFYGSQGKYAFKNRHTVCPETIQRGVFPLFWLSLAFLHISDPKQRCKLFDSLVLPILSYACEVWAVDKKVGESAEQLHWQLLKHVLGVRGNTATLIVLAEFGRYPLHFHWWQQILRHHNRINNLPDDERLIQCAFVEGLHDQPYCFWSHKVQTWLQLQSTALNIEDEICVSTVIDNAKTLYRQDFNQAGHSVGSIGRCCSHSIRIMCWPLIFLHSKSAEVVVKPVRVTAAKDNTSTCRLPGFVQVRPRGLTKARSWQVGGEKRPIILLLLVSRL